MNGIDIIKGLTFPTVALFFGVILLFLAIAQKVEIGEIKIQLSSLLQSILLGILGLFLVGIGTFLHFQTNQLPQSVVLTVYPTLTFTPSNTLPAALNSTPSVIIQTDTQTPTLLPSNSSTPTPTLSATQTFTPSPSLTFTPFPSLTLTTPPSSDSVLEFCLNANRVNIREGPGESYPVVHTLSSSPSDPVCLLFDSRTPDSSWIRIADKQKQSKYSAYSGGWISSTLLRPNDFESLKIFIPKTVQEGLYCVNTRYGVNVRICPNQNCYVIGKLSYQDCLYIDARTDDGQWVRVSEKQSNSDYLRLQNGWINRHLLSPMGFSSRYESFSEYYFNLLPIVTPQPTPEG